MCLMSEEVVTMSCGLTKVNYSHCPLKKRPVYISHDLDETKDVPDTLYLQSEPENLSTKSEDLQITCNKVGSSRRVAPIYKNNTESLDDGTSHMRYFKTRQNNGQLPTLQSPQQVDHLFGIHCKDALETTKLNSSSKNWHDIYPSAMQHVSVCYPAALPRHDTPYEVNMYYCYPSTMSSKRHISPYGFCDSSSPYQFRPYISTVTKSCTTHETSDSSGLSPYFSTPSPLHSSYLAAFSSPKTPDDLSSPGSFAGSEGSSNESTEYGTPIKDKRTGSRYQCRLCTKSYSTYSGLSNHQHFHHSAENCHSTPKKTFICKYCEKTYVSLGALKMHIRTHTLPCKCVICGKAFSRPWLLQGHIRTHTGEKPFSCPLCERAFADRSNLRAHLQTHYELKRYSCANCRKSYSRMSLLAKHQDSGCSGLCELSEKSAD